MPETATVFYWDYYYSHQVSGATHAVLIIIVCNHVFFIVPIQSDSESTVKLHQTCSVFIICDENVN